MSDTGRGTEPWAEDEARLAQREREWYLSRLRQAVLHVDITDASEHQTGADTLNQDERCATCKHWHNPWASAEGEHGLVGHEEAPRWGTCRLIALHADHSGRGPVSLPAFTKDGSDYKADLHTRADFGCTLWEAK